METVRLVSVSLASLPVTVTVAEEHVEHAELYRNDDIR
jgi:hypothetical protein